jgi:hypothetical protein
MYFKIFNVFKRHEAVKKAQTSHKHGFCDLKRNDESHASPIASKITET